MSEQATAEAAAAVTAAMFGTAGAFNASVEPEPEIRDEAPEQGEQPVAVQEAEEVSEETAAPVATFELNPKLPEDIAAELAEADFDAEVEAEVAAYEPQVDEYGDPVEVDSDVLREKIRLEKRVAFLEKQVVQSKATQWRKEGEQFFPLAKHALDDIAEKATSRRQFLKLAKAEHERILPHVQEYLAAAKSVVDGEKATATSEARAKVEAAWGEPVAGPDSGVGDAAAYDQRIEKARKTGRLENVFREMLKGGN